MKNSETPTILAIGDTVIDAFIKISDATVLPATDGHGKLLAVRYGDKVPYDSVTVCNAVGNAANAAVSAARLGVSSAFLTYVGDDQNGRDCIAELEKNGVSAKFVHTKNGKKTNYHYVLWHDIDRTILIKHENFTYDITDIADVQPNWIYVSSLGEHPVDTYEQISAYIEEHPGTKLAFQPGVFDIKTGAENLQHIYSRTEAVCVNVEEAQTILKEESRDLKTLLRGLAALGPKKVFITDGFDGAYAHENGTDDFYFVPVYPHTPFERTGAGDAFFSTVVTALALGKNHDEALCWGPINSQSVVQHVGAQEGLLTREKLE